MTEKNMIEKQHHLAEIAGLRAEIERLKEELAKEREACAKIAEEVGEERKDGRKMKDAQIAAWCKNTAHSIAERIRQRMSKP
jgi:hypothetical protein